MWGRVSQQNCCVSKRVLKCPEAALRDAAALEGEKEPPAREGFRVHSRLRGDLHLSLSCNPQAQEAQRSQRGGEEDEGHSDEFLTLSDLRHPWIEVSCCRRLPQGLISSSSSSETFGVTVEKSSFGGDTLQLMDQSFSVSPLKMFPVCVPVAPREARRGLSPQRADI
ncbi:hypothetical protein KUCAC02_034128 [Chaenocephalus aceratus]|nr:hypothetical protein KUCAC02_034128 [Chaenocephalus aceratus]